MAARALFPVLLLSWLAALAAAAPVARAGEPPHRAEARDWYQKGIRHYELGELDLAAQELKRAYELNPAPGLLFNLGQVYRLKKDDEQALHFYRTYLRLQPNASNRPMVESLIAELRARLDEKARTPPPPPPEPAPGPPAPAITPPGAQAPATAPPTNSATPAPTAVTPPPVAPPPPPPARASHWRVELGLGVAATAAGLGALGAALALGLHADTVADGLAGESNADGLPWDATRQARYDEGQRSATTATALYVVGGALVAGGVVVGVLGLRARSHERHRAIVLAPAGAASGVACAY